MSLQAELDQLRDDFKRRQPPEVLDTMRRATQALAASGQAGRTPKVGEAAPFFTLPDENGRPVSLRVLLEKGTLVLTFYRGTWCPFCMKDLQALQAALPDIEALGGALTAVSPQTAANGRKALRQNTISFPVLTDKGNDVAAAFGLRFRLPDEVAAIYKSFGNDLALVNGEPSWTLPMPARFVVGRDGIILHAEVNADHTVRSEPASLLPVLHAAMARAG